MSVILMKTQLDTAASAIADCVHITLKNSNIDSVLLNVNKNPADSMFQVFDVTRKYCFDNNILPYNDMKSPLFLFGNYDSIDGNFIIFCNESLYSDYALQFPAVYMTPSRNSVFGSSGNGIDLKMTSAGGYMSRAYVSDTVKIILQHL